jgi:hypothetical protein
MHASVIIPMTINLSSPVAINPISVNKITSRLIAFIFDSKDIPELNHI